MNATRLWIIAKIMGMFPRNIWKILEMEERDIIDFSVARLWITIKFIRDVFLKYLEDFKDGRGV